MKMASKGQTKDELDAIENFARVVRLRREKAKSSQR